MALVNQDLYLEITPGTIPPILNVTEYDENMQVVVHLRERGQAYEIPSGVTAKVEGTLAGHPFRVDATPAPGEDTVTFELDKSMTAFSGRAWTKLKLVKDNKPVHTCGFWLDCDRAGVEAGDVIGAPGFEDQINQGVYDYLDDKHLDDVAFLPFGLLANGSNLDDVIASGHYLLGAAPTYEYGSNPLPAGHSGILLVYRTSQNYGMQVVYDISEGASAVYKRSAINGSYAGRSFSLIGVDANIVDEIRGNINENGIADVFRAGEDGTQHNGVTYTHIQHGSYLVSGTASSDSFCNIVGKQNELPDGVVAGRDYLITFDGGKVPLRVYIYTAGDTVIRNVFQDTTIHIPLDATGMIVRFQVAQGRTYDETVNYKMISLPSVCVRTAPHKIAVFGDSIMWGAVSGGSVPTRNTMPQALADRIAADVDNYAEGGMGFLRPADRSGKIAYDVISETDLSAYDTIVMCFGVNDGFSPIGAFDSSDETTCLGQFNKILNHLGTTYPGKRIIVVAPWNGRNVGTFPKYWYGEVPSTAHSRGALSDALKAACEYYSVPYIEQKDSPINGWSISTLIGADGVHPTEEAYYPLGQWFAAKISSII